MTRARLRRYWATLHRWVGLVFGGLLLLAALTGSLLVLARPLDEALHPGLFRASGTVTAPLTPVIAQLRGEFGPEAVFTLRLPLHPSESLQASVAGNWNGTVYLNPSTGQEQGRRASGSGFVNMLFELHSTLFAAETGRAILALAAFAYLVMWLTGLTLWWPVRWRRAFSVRIRAGLKPAVFDAHRVAGATLGLLVLVSVATGAYLAWRPLAGWVSHLAGQPLAQVPGPRKMSGNGTLALTADDAVRLARLEWSDGIASQVRIPPSDQTVVRVRIRLPDDPHPVGMSTVWLDSQSGRVLLARHWSDLDAGTRAFSMVYPLHIGGLAGVATILSTFAAGMALVASCVSGLWLWWQRRRTRHGDMETGRR
jgi:uncharacterized iron-regulated membrane protein